MKRTLGSTKSSLTPPPLLPLPPPIVIVLDSEEDSSADVCDRDGLENVFPSLNVSIATLQSMRQLQRFAANVASFEWLEYAAGAVLETTLWISVELETRLLSIANCTFLIFRI